MFDMDAQILQSLARHSKLQYVNGTLCYKATVFIMQPTHDNE